MHTVPTGRASEIREVYDVDRCSGCGGRLAAPHAVMGWLPCRCPTSYEGRGHRQWWCADCGSWTYDPPHHSLGAETADIRTPRATRGTVHP